MAQSRATVVSAAQLQTPRIVGTPAAIAAIESAGSNPSEYLARHFSGDWGTVCAEDAAANDAALVDGSRVLSAYLLDSGDTVWIITESDRSVTTILLPEDY